MSVNIEMAYAKKLGLPEYSSHQFSAALTTEVGNIEDVPAEVERVYQILQSSVDRQIVNPGFVPGAEVPIQDTTNKADTEPWRCSEKQRALILKVIKENKLDRSEVEQLAQDRFGHGIANLNKLEASGLIDELLKQTGRTSGRRSFSQRRAA